MRIQQEMTMYEKLEVLSDAAKYDVACTSSGVDRRGTEQVSGIVKRRESVIAFRRMEGVFHF